MFKANKQDAPEAGVKAKKNSLDIFDFSGENAITVKDVDLFYGEFQALKKINMQMPKYKITAMIGPSGCGKSTLIGLRQVHAHQVAQPHERSRRRLPRRGRDHDRRAGYL